MSPRQHLRSDSRSRTTLDIVGGKPRNAASDFARYGFSQMHEPDFIAGLADRLSDEFVFEDRRKMLGLGESDRSELSEGYLLLHDLGGPARVEVQEVLAVRGRRLVALRVRHTFTDQDIYLESIFVIQYDRPVFLTERTVLLDSENVEEAIAELDRMDDALQALAG